MAQAPVQTCFVMQVFDGAEYDIRYEETFAPAIKAAGVIPARADKILGTHPVMDKIEAALKNATVAFADVSEDNPNVFTELGYALALQVPLVIVCDAGKRDRLPFDIQHRPVIFYRTTTQGGFRKLSQEIEAAVGAALAEAKGREQVVRVIPDNATQPAVDALITRLMMSTLEAEMGDPEGITAYRLTSEATKIGYSERIVSLALLSARDRKLLSCGMAMDHNGAEYIVYTTTDEARKMLLGQYSNLLREEEKSIAANRRGGGYIISADDLDDDVPF